MGAEPWNCTAGQPRAFHRPATEFYALATYLTTIALYVFFLAWAFLPDQWLHWAGITYYPDRQWVITVGAAVPVLYWSSIMIYMGMYHWQVPAFGSPNATTDGFALKAPPQLEELMSSSGRTIPPVFDCSPEVVSAATFLCPHHHGAKARRQVSFSTHASHHTDSH